MDTRGFEMESRHHGTGNPQRNRTETLAHLLVVLGIIMAAILPLLSIFITYNHRMNSFLFDPGIMIITQYLLYLGFVVFVLGLVLIERIRMRSPQTRTRTALPVFGGVLLILGGVYTTFAYPLLWLVETLNGVVVSLDTSWLILELATIVISILAGVLALKRRQWSLVLIACSTAFFTASIFGLLAIVPIALSRFEFAQEQYF
jgi:hypothetical protein